MNSCEVNVLDPSASLETCIALKLQLYCHLIPTAMYDSKLEKNSNQLLAAELACEDASFSVPHFNYDFNRHDDSERVSTAVPGTNTFPAVRAKESS